MLKPWVAVLCVGEIAREGETEREKNTEKRQANKQRQYTSPEGQICLRSWRVITMSSLRATVGSTVM